MGLWLILRIPDLSVRAEEGCPETYSADPFLCDILLLLKRHQLCGAFLYLHRFRTKLRGHSGGRERGLAGLLLVVKGLGIWTTLVHCKDVSESWIQSFLWGGEWRPSSFECPLHYKWMGLCAALGHSRMTATGSPPDFRSQHLPKQE